MEKGLAQYKWLPLWTDVLELNKNLVRHVKWNKLEHSTLLWHRHQSLLAGSCHVLVLSWLPLDDEHQYAIINQLNPFLYSLIVFLPQCFITASKTLTKTSWYQDSGILLWNNIVCFRENYKGFWNLLQECNWVLRDQSSILLVLEKQACSE